nr:T9SS type A sorting domain-containing protein [Bacteroidota bacterium]
DYTDPNASELSSWGAALDYLLTGNYALADASAAIIGYDLIQFLDTSETIHKTYYILKNNSTNYWGTYVYYPDYCRPLVIQSPHPLKDHNTGEQGIHVFIKTQALFFCLSGTSRCNSSSYSGCTGTTSVCSGSPESYRISDLSHSISTIYQNTTDVLFNDFSNSYFIQLHGFTKLSTDPYVILSNGTQITPDPDYIVPLSNHLYNEDNVLTFKIAHIDLSWTRLRGFFNTQGRLINSSADPCGADATTTSGRFINVEQEKTLLRDDEAGWDKLANALNNTFICYPLVWDGSSGTDWNTAGNWRNNTVPTSTDNVTIANMANGLVIDEAVDSPAQCNHMEIQGNASVTINAGKALTVNGNLNNTGTLVVASTSSLTGSLIVEGEIFGIANIERYISGWGDALHGWHLLSSPVTSQAISAFHTAGSGDDFFKWDEVNNTWVNRTASGGGLNGDFETEFMQGNGYLIANSTNSIQAFKGIPNNSDVTKSDLTYTDVSASSGWHLLGNPFSSAIIWNRTDWGLTNIDATAKIWDESSASYTDIAAGTGVIPAMQGFFVHVNAATGSLTIDASDRTHHSQNWYKTDEPNQMKLVVYDVDGNTRQACVIKINENATTGFDREFDSRFLAGYAPQFYAVIDEGTLSTNTLPELTEETIIPLGFIKNSSSDFYFEAQGLDNFQQETFYFTDLKANHTQILNQNQMYSFVSEEGDDPNRFIIHLSLPEVNELQLPQQIKVFVVGNNIEVNSQNPLEAELNIYGVTGQRIKNSKLNNSSSASVNMGDFKGVVIVSIVTQKTVFSKKVFVW